MGSDVSKSAPIWAAGLAAGAVVTAAALEFGPRFGCQTGLIPAWCEEDDVGTSVSSDFVVEHQFLVEGTYVDNQVAVLVNGNPIYSHWHTTNGTAPRADLFGYLEPGLNSVTVLGVNYGGPGELRFRVTADRQSRRVEGQNSSPGFILVENFVVERR